MFCYREWLCVIYQKVNKRKILVFAHVPPPHHGQSVMVQIMLEGLRADPRFEVHHVDAQPRIYELTDR
jgi:hypothetical protein